MHPKLHQSTSVPYYLPQTISGAMYSGVPANVFVESPSRTFERPKSVNLMCPSLSRSTFSGFKSQYTMAFPLTFCECKISSAKIISAA